MAGPVQRRATKPRRAPTNCGGGGSGGASSL